MNPMNLTLKEIRNALSRELDSYGEVCASEVFLFLAFDEEGGLYPALSYEGDPLAPESAPESPVMSFDIERRVADPLGICEEFRRAIEVTSLAPSVGEFALALVAAAKEMAKMPPSKMTRCASLVAARRFARAIINLPMAAYYLNRRGAAACARDVAEASFAGGDCPQGLRPILAIMRDRGEELSVFRQDQARGQCIVKSIVIEFA